MNTIIEGFLSFKLINENRSEKTIIEYRNDLTLFFNFLIENKIINSISINTIKKIQKKDIEMFIMWTATNGIKKKNIESTRARRISAIKSFFKYLAEENFIKDNPSINLKKPKIGKRLPKYLNLNQSIELLNCIDGINKIRDYAIINMFLNTGLRLSELVNINFDSIEGDSLKVIGKGNKERKIFLSETVIQSINNYLKVRPNNLNESALFLSSFKKRINKGTVEYIVKKFLNKINLGDFSTHKLRHTAATLMYQNGAGIKELKEILGHEKINTTEIYTHVDDKQIKKAINSNPLNNLKDRSENYVGEISR